MAEQAVLAADNPRGLRTCSLRPHLVWGPRDHHLTAKLIERARSGRLRRVGDGANLVDMIYVENAAEGHLLAADALQSPRAEARSPGGRAYFLSQGVAVNCWAWIDEILALVKLSPVRKSLSLAAARRVGLACGAIWTITGQRSEPPMTRFLASQLATSHWFDISAARRDLGYEPRVSMVEGMERLGEWLRTR
jgi:nucleoside-diphosphate-sugar epimerase